MLTLIVFCYGFANQVFDFNSGPFVN